MEWLVFKFHLLFTIYLTGLVWFVQIVHYPMMAKVGKSNFLEYEQTNVSLTAWVTAPQMLLELGTALLLLWWNFTDAFWWINLLLLAGIWLSTFFIQVPYHNRLSQLMDLQTIKKLSNSNWIRTLLWTSRAVLLLFFK